MYHKGPSLAGEPNPFVVPEPECPSPTEGFQKPLELSPPQFRIIRIFLPFLKKGKKPDTSLREGPLLRYSESGEGEVDNKQRFTFRCMRITFFQLLPEAEKQTKIP